MTKLRELLKKMGLKPTVIDKYFSEKEEDTKDLDPVKDAELVLNAIKDVHKNEIEDDIKKEADKTARAHVYGEVEQFFMKEGGFKKEDIVAGGTAEPKWKDYGNFFKKKIGEPKDDGKKTAITDLQEQLRQSEEKNQALALQVEEAKSGSTKAIDEFKFGLKKETTLIKMISGMEKKTILPAEKVLRLINDRISEQAEIVAVGDGFEVRDKANPEKKINKSATEFKSLQDLLTEVIESEELFEKSNGDADRKKMDMGSSKKDGETTPVTPKRRSTLPQSAIDTAKENEALKTA